MTKGPPKQPRNKTVKFMQTLSIKQWDYLQSLALKRDMTVQQYLQFFVIHDVMPKNAPSPERSDRVKKGWETRKRNQEEAEKKAKEMAYPQ
jgi:hypothetical protein